MVGGNTPSYDAPTATHFFFKTYTFLCLADFYKPNESGGSNGVTAKVLLGKKIKTFITFKTKRTMKQIVFMIEPKTIVLSQYQHRDRENSGTLI